jgi:hypothetical protein
VRRDSFPDVLYAARLQLLHTCSQLHCVCLSVTDRHNGRGVEDRALTMINCHDVVPQSNTLEIPGPADQGFRQY